MSPIIAQRRSRVLASLHATAAKIAEETYQPEHAASQLHQAYDRFIARPEHGLVIGEHLATVLRRTRAKPLRYDDRRLDAKLAIAQDFMIAYNKNAIRADDLDEMFCGLGIISQHDDTYVRGLIGGLLLPTLEGFGLQELKRGGFKAKHPLWVAARTRDLCDQPAAYAAGIIHDNGEDIPGFDEGRMRAACERYAHDLWREQSRFARVELEQRLRQDLAIACSAMRILSREEGETFVDHVHEFLQEKSMRSLPIALIVKNGADRPVNLETLTNPPEKAIFGIRHYVKNLIKSAVVLEMTAEYLLDPKHRDDHYRAEVKEAFSYHAVRSYERARSWREGLKANATGQMQEAVLGAVDAIVNEETRKGKFRTVAPVNLRQEYHFTESFDGLLGTLIALLTPKGYCGNISRRYVAQDGKPQELARLMEENRERVEKKLSTNPEFAYRVLAGLERAFLMFAIDPTYRLEFRGERR